MYIAFFIYFAMVFLFFAFCESSKRIGLLLPFLWVIFFFAAAKYYTQSNFLSWLVVIAGFFIVIFFIFCVIESMIRIFNPGFDFFQRHRDKKLEEELRSIGRFPGQLDMYHIFPVLKNNMDYQIIYNHCQTDDELSEFTEDWNEYFLDLQSMVYRHPETKPDDLYINFDEWYQKNERWKETSYHHIYYRKQEKYYNS